MTREWKPGDVALVDYGTGVEVMMRDRRGWFSHCSEINADDGAIESTRPLVVIDPEDREQARRLLSLYHDARCTLNDLDPADDMRAALRNFADPPSPCPDEPLLLGAVVQDNNTIWLRDGLDKDGASDGPWWSPDRSKEGSPEPWRLYWSDLENPHVLSPGYDPEATS